jgi:hypothetical protein
LGGFLEVESAKQTLSLSLLTTTSAMSERFASLDLRTTHRQKKQEPAVSTAGS